MRNRFLVIIAAAGLLVLLTPNAPAQGRGGGSQAPVNPLLTPNPYNSPPEVKGGPVPHLPDGKPDMQGVWLVRAPGNSMSMLSVESSSTGRGERKGVIVDPPDGKIPYQPWARQKQQDLAANHMLEESDAHCLLGGFPHSSFTPFGFRLLQPPGEVAMVWEFMHAWRVIPMDGSPHLDAKTKLYMGDSRGRWDGDTLVVDVTNQKGRSWIDQSADFHSDAIHVVERFTMTDSNNMTYEATVEDPKVYTQLWKMVYYFSKYNDPKYEALEFACIEGEVDMKKH
ncbi:MAG TPA: hypothetical protein VHZ74_26215 [Bryobacteraceae bacterium]|nr:hypothetical protein [Bryobacteraceae bacterium]